MTQRYALTTEALEDLLAIWSYVYRQAGSVKRADAKVGALYAMFETLADRPDLGTGRKWLPDDVIAFPKLGYVIAFRRFGREIEVLRVTGSEDDLLSIE